MSLRGVGRRSVTSGRVLGSLGSAVAGQGILVVSGVLVARVLGVEGRGELALIILVPGILAEHAPPGLPFAFTHVIAWDWFTGKELARQFGRLAAGITSVLTVLPAAVLPVSARGKPEVLRPAYHNTCRESAKVNNIVICDLLASAQRGARL